MDTIVAAPCVDLKTGSADAYALVASERCSALSEHGLQHLGDEALAGLAQLGDGLDLLLLLRRRAPLSARGRLVLAEQFIE